MIINIIAEIPHCIHILLPYLVSQKNKALVFSLVFTSVFHWLLTFLQKATIRFKENSLNLNFFRLMIKFCTWQFVTFWALRHGHLKTLGGDIITRHRGTGSMSQDKSFTKLCIWTSPGLKKMQWHVLPTEKIWCTYKDSIRIMLLHYCHPIYTSKNCLAICSWCFNGSDFKHLLLMVAGSLATDPSV